MTNPFSGNESSRTSNERTKISCLCTSKLAVLHSICEIKSFGHMFSHITSESAQMIGDSFFGRSAIFFLHISDMTSSIARLVSFSETSERLARSSSHSSIARIRLQKNQNISLQRSNASMENSGKISYRLECSEGMHKNKKRSSHFPLSQHHKNSRKMS